MALNITRNLVKESGRWRKCQDVFTLKGMMSRTQASASAIPSACPFNQTPAENEFSPSNDGNYKSYAEIPHKKGLPLVGTLFHILLSGGATRMHEYCHRRHQELGPIFREKLGPVETVVISQKEFIRQVYAVDGKYPVHFLPQAWVVYNELKGIKRGLFFLDGEEWNRRRKLLNPLFLDIKEIRNNYGAAFNDIITDTLERWDQICSQNNRILPNLEEELYNWSIESLGIMIFGRRLGCVRTPYEKGQKHERHNFVNCIRQVFFETVKLSMFPPKLAYKMGLPRWKRFERAATNAIETAREYMEELIAETKSMENTGQKAILTSLMDNEDISHDEIVSTVADLVLAAADTTSHAVQWTLYLLAKNPECQEKLLEEINSVVPPGEIVTEKHTENLSYCMGAIKEALRMYPVASFLTRYLSQSTVLGGYKIPAGQMISMSLHTVGRDPETFPDPEKFMPERFVREKDKPYESKSHACIPFGMGARSCIGRRAAEEQMRLIISRIVQNSRVKLMNKKEVQAILRMVTTPSNPILLHFEPRSK